MVTHVTSLALISTVPVCMHRDGTNYGTIYVFRDYTDHLYISVALDGSTDGQWFYQVPNPGAA